MTREPTNYQLPHVQLLGALGTLLILSPSTTKVEKCKGLIAITLPAVRASLGPSLEGRRKQAKSRSEGCSHSSNDLHLQVSPRGEPARKTLHRNLEILFPHASSLKQPSSL